MHYYDRFQALPLISIIIPVFNVAPYLREALDSVINQTYANVEIIIIDDGSTDESGAICDEYRHDPRVRVIHQENKGLSAARNAGLVLMTGEMVAFLDSDDAYCLDYISSMHHAMLLHSSDVVICKYTIHHTTGKMDNSIKEEIRPEAIEGMYERTQALRAFVDGTINCSVWNKLYKSELWKNVRFPVGHVYEDMETICSIFDISRSIYVLNDLLYLHRKRPGSITTTKSWENMQDYLKADAHILSYIADHTPGIFSPEQKRKWSESYLKKMIVAYLRFNREELVTQIMEAAKEIDIIACNLRVRTAYWMFRFCPRLLRCCYPFYHPVRKIYLSSRKKYKKQFREQNHRG